MNTITLWQWQVKDASGGRWRQLRWKMTESAAADWATREGKELRKVVLSAETRQPEDRPGGLMTNLGTRN